MRQILVSIAIAVLVAQAAPASAAAEESTLEHAGYGAGSVLGTIVYAPFKATFCLLGGIGAGVTAIASRDTARQVLDASCGGTWLITPDVMRGQESVDFVGDSRRADFAGDSRRARTIDTTAVALR